MGSASTLKRFWKPFISAFLLICISPSLSGGYVVTTPRRWTAGESSQVCITLSSPATPEDTLSVAIKERNAEVETFILPSTDILILPGETSICDKVLLPDTKKGHGDLLVTGSLEGKTIDYNKKINIAKDVAKTFVQTDKYLYKPSQLVQFRILTVTGPFLKVSLDQYEEIWIENPSGTRITQWLKVPNESGLIHLSFTLSDEPEEGKYKIRVRTHYGKIVDQTFKVEEYVLPRYEVKIKPPSYILGTSPTFTFRVCAKYTFGQPVKGNLTLSVDNNGWGTYKIVIKKNETISGCKKIEFTADELSINGKNYFAYSLKANAVVQEEGTGVELKAKEISVDISRTALDFEDVGVQQFFKPELPFIGEVLVKLPDKSPAVNEPMEVCSNDICKKLNTNTNGLLKFAVPPHLDHSISIKAVNYKHVPSNDSWRSVMYESSFRKSVKRYHSPSNSSLVVAIEDDELDCSVADTIDFQLPVRYTAVGQDVASVSIQVVSRGQIQFSKMFEKPLSTGGSLHVDESILIAPMKEPETKGLVRGHFTVPISLPKTVSPKGKVIVWYPRSDGEVISDARVLDITECLLNAVNITWSTDKAQPGDLAQLSIAAEPLSLCSLGVVDKSVQLLSAKKSSLTVGTLLDVAESSSVGRYENNQVDDYEYCRNKEGTTPPPGPIPPILPPVALPVAEDAPVVVRRKRSSPPYFWRPFYSDDIDALFMFDVAGLYVLSDLTLETRPCRRRYEPRGRPTFYSGIARSMVGDRVSSRKPMVVAYAPSHYRTSNLGPPGRASPAAQRGSPSKPKKRTSEKRPRTYMPETWLWKLVVTDVGYSKETVTLPDTVTEWVGSAVCVHPTKGVGISGSASITTFRDFFADLTLPPSVKRGEIFPVKISVFNYLKEKLPVKVVLYDSPDYDILADDSDELGNGERDSCLPAEDKTVHSVRIRTKEIGNVNITVAAFVDTNSIGTCGQGTGKIRTDVLVKPIRVELEGFPKEETWSNYICAKDLETNEDTLEPWIIEIPPSIVPDSARGFLSVVGDLMGPTLENLGSLVKMPYGCGEQNMLNFAPNIFVMQYLDASNQNNEETAETAIDYMKKGYQRELNYRHSDGSFSAFGERDDSGSTWLTAFVLKSFAQARPYISVDADDLNISRDWLKRRQLENGCFESVGKVLHKGMKGGLAGTSSPALLSSFVLIALLEAGESSSGNVIREALFCLHADEPTRNPYSMAVKAYALALAGSNETQSAIDTLLNVATDQGRILYWEIPKEYESSKGVGVETAGYAVLALLAHGGKSQVDYSPQVQRIVKWMNNERNGQGGFVSTQDTIVALQALAEFEKTIPQGPVDLHIIPTMIDSTGLETAAAFKVDETNKLLLQKVKIESVPTTVTWDISGTGCALVQAVLRYNIPETDLSDAFSLRVETSTEPDKGCKTKRIKACSSYLLDDLKSNMAIIQINIVSGYIPEKADLKRIVGYGTGLFKRYEVDGSVVTIYVDEFSPEEICVSFRIIREVEVENPKPGSVKVYDYYKPELVVTEKYTLPPTTQCLNADEEFPLLDEIIVDALPIETEVNEGPLVDGTETPPTTESFGDMLNAFDEAIP